MTDISQQLGDSEWHLRIELLTVDQAAEAAVRLAQLHGLAVFPVHSYDFQALMCTCYNPNCAVEAKHPMTLHGHLDATTDPDEIRRLFTNCAARESAPYANIGVACGTPSGGVIVVDVDPRNGGWDSMGEIEYIAGVQGTDLGTLTSATGGGGAHFWYRIPAGIEVPKKGKIKTGIDLQAEGAYVVAPPSLHKSGTRYSWGQPRPMMYFPSIFINLASEANKRDFNSGGFTLPNGATLSDVLAGKSSIPEGSRDEAFTSLAARLRFADTPRDEAEATILRVLEESTDKGGSPFTAEQALAKVASAYRRLDPDPALSDDTLKEAAETFLEGLKRHEIEHPDNPFPVEGGSSLELQPQQQSIQSLRSFLEEYDLALDTDSANAHRIAIQHEGRMHFFAKAKRADPWWLCPPETNMWVSVPDAGERAARDLERMVRLEALQRDDDDERDRLVEWAKRCAQTSAISAAAKNLSWHPEVVVSDAPQSYFDTNPWLLSFPNGVMDFSSGEFRERQASDKVSRSVAYPYEPGAACPMFMEFLHRVQPDDEVRACLLRFIGQSLIGTGKEQRMGVWTGSGANGKTTGLTIIRKVLGDYASELPTSIFVSKNGREQVFDLPQLEGKRFGMNTVEIEADEHLNDGVLKAIVGLEEVQGRGLYENFRSIKTQATLFISANNMPKLHDTSYGMRRRLLAFNFAVTIAEADRDPLLVPRILAEEGPGILTLLVRECFEYLRSGLHVPKQLDDYTDEYVESENPFLRFEKQFLHESRTDFHPLNTIFQFYNQWCDAEGETALNRVHFGRQLSKTRYPETIQTIDGRKTRCRYVRLGPGENPL